MPNDIQSVRYELPMQAPRGFMSYAADAAQAYYKKKKEVEDAKRAEMLAAFPTLAAHGGVRVPSADEKPDFVLGGVPWKTQTPRMTGATTPLPGYEGVPGISDWGDVKQYHDVQKQESWAKGKPTPEAVYDKTFQNLFMAGMNPVEAQREAMRVMESLRTGEPVKVDVSKMRYHLRKGNKQIHSPDQKTWYDDEGNVL